MAHPKLILASASPRRLQLLSQIGITPDRIIPAGLDETVRAGELPRAHATRMAQEKARAVHATLAGEQATVLAADTVVACGRRILTKAQDNAAVETCLALLSGRRHTVMTAVTLINSGGHERSRLVETKVAFRRLQAAEIDSYIESGEGLGKAGGYAIQGHAAVFVRFISGSYSNVVGLPLMETFQLITSCAAG